MRGEEGQRMLFREEHPKPKRGELWKLGSHLLMCGDSTDMGQVRYLTGGEKCGRLFTDPPYGMSYQSVFSDLHCSTGRTCHRFRKIENDDTLLDFLPVAKECVDGFVFVCTTWKVLDMWLPYFERYYRLTNRVVWNKCGLNGGLGDLKRTFKNTYELILVSHCGHCLTGGRIDAVWDIYPDSPEQYRHPTQKPVKLAKRAIENTTYQGDTVLDLFGGGGSTLLACEETGRRCRRMELDEGYCAVIVERWEGLTGRKAELAGKYMPRGKEREE